MRVLVTGCAGFIGSHLAERLIEDGHTVRGVDNFDPYYAREIKIENLANLLSSERFTFQELDILDKDKLNSLGEVDIVLHLAAKAGVRPSIENPYSYIETNIAGTNNLLEWMVSQNCKNIIFASSSSVYGNQKKVPFSENQTTDSPISPYAASKKACELLIHSFHHVYDLNVLNLRLFTVYGPRQRPDLAIRKFMSLLANEKSIPMYGEGDTFRDYTYVKDVVEGFIKSMAFLEGKTKVFDTFNIASGKPISLLDLVKIIGKTMSIQPVIENLPMQEGDVLGTYANTQKAAIKLGFNARSSVEEGIGEFYRWITSKGI